MALNNTARLALDERALNVSGRLERLPMTSYQRKVFFAVATAWLADQINVLLFIFLIGSLSVTFHMTKIQIGLLASTTFAGQLIGNLFAGYMADRFGRRLIFQLTMLVWGVGSFLAAGSTGLITLMIFRLIIGIGVGGEAPVAQAIVSEIIPARMRGFYVALLEGFAPIGLIIAGGISYFIVPVFGWRWVFVLVGAFSIVIFWVRRIIFESPRWLADQGRLDEADRILTNIEREVEKCYGRALPPPKKFLPETSRPATNPIAIIFSKGYLRSTIMLFGLWFFALLGYFGLTSWLTVILHEHGFSISRSIGFVTMITTGAIPGFWTSGVLLDRVGRKMSTALFLVLSAISAYFYGTSSGIEALFIFGFLMYFFTSGMWCCLYAYSPELYPTRARSTGAGVASAVGRLGAILGPIVVGILMQKAGQGAVFSMGAISFGIAAVVVLSLGIETKGKVLEEISLEEENGTAAEQTNTNHSGFTQH